MATEEIWIGENDTRRKLVGDELTAFLAMRLEMQTKKIQAEEADNAKAAAKASAQAKLAALGLTADEIAALIP